MAPDTDRRNLSAVQDRQAFWRCGHPKSHENTRYSEDGGRCLQCRRALERKASKRYRGKAA